MKGELRVESTPGQGSHFTVIVPLRRLDEGFLSSTEEDHKADVVRGYNRLDGRPEAFTILVVDDAADNRAVLRALLEPLGFSIREADGGEAALAAARAEPTDLVLMDLVMPDIDGLETTHSILSAPGLETLRIVACSASAFPEDQAKSRAAGCIDHIAKPVQAAALLGTLKRHLPLEWLRELDSAPKHALGGETTNQVLSGWLSESERKTLSEWVQMGNITQLRKWMAEHPGHTNAGVKKLRDAVFRCDLKQAQSLLDDSGYGE